MSWQKSDGAKIKIDFNLPLVGSDSISASSFTVTVPEYDFVPNGTLHNVVKAVNSVSEYTGQSELIDLSTGTQTNVAYANGVLTLEVES